MPQALTRDRVQRVIEEARTLGAAPGASSVQCALYRLVVAGIFFGLWRGELRHLNLGRHEWAAGVGPG